MNLDDKIRVLPIKGCCNSTLSFQEWTIIGLFSIKNKGNEIPMVVAESDGYTDIFRQDRVEKLNQNKYLYPVASVAVQ